MTGAQHLPARHRTLRNAIAWSYELLNPTEQAVFRCLGVFAGGCPLSALAAVVSSQFAVNRVQSSVNAEHWLLTAVSSLVNHSLVLQQQETDGEARFTLLEMMREYALEQLEQHGEAEAAHHAHATWFLHLAERHEAVANDVKGNVVALVGRMEREIDNLRTALQWAATDDPDLELRLIAAMTQFWSVRRHLSEGRQWLERLVPRLQTAAPQFQPAQRTKFIEIHFMLAFFTWLQGDYALAQSRFEETIELAREGQAWETLGSALQFLALTFYERGDYSTAYPLALESVTLLREFGDPWHLGNALTNLGIISMANGDQTTAWTLHEEALAIFHQVDNTWGVKLTLLGLSEIYFAQGDDERARTCLEDAQQTFREDGQSWFVAQTLLYLGKVQWRNDAKVEATGSWSESIALAREAGAKRYLAEALYMSGLAAQEGGDQQRAQALFTESLGLYQRMENRIGVAYALSGLASIMEQPAQRARLLGGAATVLDRARLPIDPIERAHYEATVAAVRSQLGEAAFATAWAEGQAMTLEEAVAYALAIGQA